MAFTATLPFIVINQVKVKEAIIIVVSPADSSFTMLKFDLSLNSRLLVLKVFSKEVLTIVVIASCWILVLIKINPRVLHAIVAPLAPIRFATAKFAQV